MSVGVAAASMHTTTFLFMVITLPFLPWTFQYVLALSPQGNSHVFSQIILFLANSYHSVWHPYLGLIYIVTASPR